MSTPTTDAQVMKLAQGSTFVRIPRLHPVDNLWINGTDYTESVTNLSFFHDEHPLLTFGEETCEGDSCEILVDLLCGGYNEAVTDDPDTLYMGKCAAFRRKDA